MQNSLFPVEHNLLPFDGDVEFFPNFFSAEESKRLFDQLSNNIQWKQEPILIYGKEVMQPRLTAWYGDVGKTYSYSGITMVPFAWNETLLGIKHRVEQDAKVSFNSALLNFYRDGDDSVGWHRDNEKELGPNPVIGSVSFGATRTFQFRNYKDKTIRQSIDLTNGSFLLMKGATQHCWEHQIPKTAKQIKGRINITFRVIV